MVSNTTKQSRQFLKSSSGAVAPMIGISIFALVLVVGLTIDVRRIQGAKTHTQDATDAAVLAAARGYMLDTNEDISKRQAKAQIVASDYLRANLQATSKNFKTANIVLQFSEDGEILGQTSTEVDLIFGNLFGMHKQTIQNKSAVKAGNAESVEIMLVLDNSASMFEGSRMTIMRNAAKGFVDTMFDKASIPNSVKIGVVPWASAVNINSEKPNAWNPGTATTTTVPDAGSRKIPKAAFENRTKYLTAPWTYSGSYSSSQIKADFAPVEWRGCISAAQNEREVKANGDVKKPLSDAKVSGMKWPALRVLPEFHATRYVKYPSTAPTPTPTPTPSSTSTPSPSPAPSPTPTPTPTPTTSAKP